jgi:hypothetical protein
VITKLLKLILLLLTVMLPLVEVDLYCKAPLSAITNTFPAGMFCIKEGCPIEVYVPLFKPVAP